MSDVVVAQNAEEFLTAYKSFLKDLKTTGVDRGHSQIANQCVNGLPGMWEIAIGKMRGELFIYAKEGSKVLGLLRIQLEPKTDAAKLQDIVTMPGSKGIGAALVNRTIELAREKGKKKVWLEAGDETLGPYYERFGFKFNNSSATSGPMTLKL